MKRAYSTLVTALFAVFMIGCNATAAQPKSDTPQSVQIYTTDNADGKITVKTIEKAFDSVGLGVDGNNNMNSPFEKRFNNIHYPVYNLAMFRNNELTLKLVKKYPRFGNLTPLTMSIYSEPKGSDKKTMSVATLTLAGMSRAGGIPMDDPDLVAYAKLIDDALKAAMPNGKREFLNFGVDQSKDYQTNFVAEVDWSETTVEEWSENFQAEFEAEMEPLGFLLPNFVNMKEELFDEAGYDEYDFYNTYSICKFDVIYPVSKLHPEAGAYAPCSFYMYKKKGEDTVYIGWLSVDNWIETLDFEDAESIDPLRDAQMKIENIITELTE